MKSSLRTLHAAANAQELDARVLARSAPGRASQALPPRRPLLEDLDDLAGSDDEYEQVYVASRQPSAAPRVAGSSARAAALRQRNAALPAGGRAEASAGSGLRHAQSAQPRRDLAGDMASALLSPLGLAFNDDALARLRKARAGELEGATPSTASAVPSALPSAPATPHMQSPHRAAAAAAALAAAAAAPQPNSLQPSSSLRFHSAFEIRNPSFYAAKVSGSRVGSAAATAAAAAIVPPLGRAASTALPTSRETMSRQASVSAPAARQASTAVSAFAAGARTGSVSTALVLASPQRTVSAPLSTALTVAGAARDASPDASAAAPPAAPPVVPPRPGFGTTGALVAAVTSRRIDVVVDDVAPEIHEYVSTYKQAKLMPDAAMLIQSLWRARGPRVLLSHHLALRNRSMVRLLADCFYPWMQRTVLSKRMERIFLRRFFRAWRDYVETYTEVSCLACYQPYDAAIVPIQ